MDDLYKTGFRRIVVVTWLEYARYYLPTEFYEDHRCGAMGIEVAGAVRRAMNEAGIREDSVMLGALRVLGRDDLVRKCMDAAQRWKKSGRTPPPLPGHIARMQAFGMPALSLPKGSYRFLPDETLNPEAGEAALRQGIEEGLPSLEALREYNEYLSRRGDRGMGKTQWFREG
jgi:hypothetical protein